MKLIYCFIIFVLLTGCKKEKETVLMGHMIYREGEINYYSDAVKKPFKVLFLSDTHFTIEDERGKEFYQYTKRMGGSAVEPDNYGTTNGREQALIRSLEKAKKEKAELVILGGDIINFPSKASVENVKEIMDASGLKWIYTAGNHDWHYEGEEGDASDLRLKWEQESLLSLYQGENPLYSSHIINNINFILIDNSSFEITDEQLNFFIKQTEKGLPIVLTIHIPLYLPGHTVDYGCGHPDWNLKNDTYYEIEGRKPWPEKGHTTTTYKFHDKVWASPNVIGILAGHTHETMMDMHNNIFQYVSDANYRDSDIILHFIPANSK